MDTRTDFRPSMTGVIWVTGYSAAGKTTVSRKLEMLLREDGVKTIFLDGDDLRSIFANRWGYERDDRVELAKVYFRLCSHLAAQGFTIIIAAVAMYDEVREWLKENVANSLEIYLDVPLDERLKRDQRTKNVYGKLGDMADLYDTPKTPDLVLQNCDQLGPDEAAGQIRDFFYSNRSRTGTDHGRNSHWNAYYSSAAAPVKPSPFAEYVADRLDPGSALLEVGCGNGRDCTFFDAIGQKVTALDKSEGAIEYCRENYADRPITFVSGTAPDLEATRAGSFDAIYSRFCIHAMTYDEEAEFLASAAHLLRSGGTLYIECRSINDPLARKGEVISPTERIDGHYRRFIVFDELAQTLKRNGFEIAESVESDGLAVYKDDNPVVIRVVARLTARGES